MGHLLYLNNHTKSTLEEFTASLKAITKKDIEAQVKDLFSNGGNEGISSFNWNIYFHEHEEIQQLCEQHILKLYPKLTT